MNRIIASLATSFLFSLTTIAANYTVTGALTDSLGTPEEFATVKILSYPDTKKVIATGVTGDNGTFSLDVKSEGQYRLIALSIGKTSISKDFTITPGQTTIDLGTLIIGSDTRILSEVTVTATKPLVTKEIDRIGYDVQADSESKTSTLDEMLRKVPLVTVDADGTITVNGSSNFKIYKNGRPNNSFTNNAKDIFKAIPAAMIKKIEVITDPGAREDAEGVGAILNIVTMENTTMKGVMGNVSLNYQSTGKYPNPNFWGSGQIDKVTLSAYLGVNEISSKTSRNQSVSEGTYSDTGNFRRNKVNTDNKGWVTWFGLDGSYELDSLNLFTAEFGGYRYNVDGTSFGKSTLSDNAGNLINSYKSNSTFGPYSYLDFNGNFNYQHSTHRKGETLTLSYMISTTSQHRNQETYYTDKINAPMPYDATLSDFKLDFIEHTVQGDWTRPINDKNIFDLGFKYIYRNNHSLTNQTYVGLPEIPITDFTHLTHVAAAYFDYRLRLKKFNFRAGLRYEFSKLKAEYANEINPGYSSNLSDAVPNVAVSYNLNDANTLKLSFNTRINRPGINYLNPAVEATPTSTSQGNPDLGSARSNQLQLNYNLIGRKVNIDLSAGYTFSNNDIVQVMDIIGDHTYSTYANAGKNKSFNSGLYFQWTITPKTNLMLNTNVAYNHYANPSLNIALGGWNTRAFMRVSQQLPWKLTLQGGLFYFDGHTSGLYSKMKPIGLAKLNYNLSLQRSFLKEDRLTVRVMAISPFYPGNVKYLTTSYNTSYDERSWSIQQYRKSFLIAISYRFGTMTAQVKKTAKTIENDDLVGRKK